MSYTFFDVIRFLRPDSQFVLEGDSYSGLKWLSDDPKPTEQELADAWPAAVQALDDAEQAEADALAAKEVTRQSALDKLTALGLTVDEISVAFGLDSN